MNIIHFEVTLHAEGQNNSSRTLADGKREPMQLSVMRSLSYCKLIRAGLMSAPQTVRYCALMRGVLGNLSHKFQQEKKHSPTVPNKPDCAQPSMQHMNVNTNTPAYT